MLTEARRAQVARQLKRPTVRWGTIAVLVALALAALLASRLITATKTAVSGPASLVGHPAPDFTVPLFNGSSGQRVHLATLRGKVVVVNFWASWCEPCQGEAPVLVAASRSYAAQGVAFVGLAVHDEQPDSLAFLRQYGITYPTGPATDALISAYALPGLPITVVVDRHGILVKRFTGPVTTATLDQALRAALASTA